MTRRIVPLIDHSDEAEPGAAGDTAQKKGDRESTAHTKDSPPSKLKNTLCSGEPPPSALNNQGPAAQEDIFGSVPKTTIEGAGGSHEQRPLGMLPGADGQPPSHNFRQSMSYHGDDAAAALRSGRRPVATALESAAGLEEGQREAQDLARPQNSSYNFRQSMTYHGDDAAAALRSGRRPV